MLKIGIQGNGWYFFAWDFKELSQSAAKHTAKIILFKMEFIVPETLTTNPKCNLYKTVFFINCQWVEELGFNNP